MRRRVPVLGVVGLVAGLAIFIGAASAQEQTTASGETTAKSSQNEVSPQATANKTFSNANPILIPSGGQATPYPSEISVGGKFGKGRIQDVDLTLKNYSHTFPDDVDVLLVKGQTNRTVMSDVGGGAAVSNITLVLDDEAPSPLPDNTQIGGGSFRPTNFEVGDSFPAPAPSTPNPEAALSGFDGQKAKGIWKLYVVDDLAGFQGQFAGGWSLKIKVKQPR
jgi:hypothetical protein